MKIAHISLMSKKSGMFLVLLLLTAFTITACTPSGLSNGKKSEVSDFRVGQFNSKVSLMSPVANNIISSPVEVNGWARQSSGSVLVRLMDFNGKVVSTGMAEVTQGSSDYGYYTTDLSFPKVVTASGWLEIYNQSAQDGSEENIVRIPVKFKNSFQVTDTVAGKVALGQFNNNMILDGPVFDGKVSNPITVSGKARVRNGIIIIRLLDFNNRVLTIRSTQASQSAPNWGTFQRDIPYFLPITAKGWLEVYTQNPITLAPENLIRIPVSFEDYINSSIEQFEGDIVFGQYNDSYIITSPVVNQIVFSPLKLSGLTRTIEGTVEYRVRDLNGAELGFGFVQASQVAPGWITFDAQLDFDQPTTKAGWLELFTTSAKDGSEEDILRILIKFE